MKTIELKTKHKNFVLLLDDDIYEYIQNNHIHITVQNSKRKHPYARYYVRENNRRKSVLLHRLIMGFPKGLVIDHINHNTLGNRRRNLRITTPIENSLNRIPNKAGHIGVGFHKGSNKWRAYYCENGKQISLGYYKTKEEAIKAREEKCPW